MPAASSSDIAHTAVTDHRIPRKPSFGNQLENANSPSLPQLVPFPNTKKTTDQNVRDLALAWQSIVNSGMTMAQPEAEQLLKEAVAQYPDDPAVLAALAYVEQKQSAKNKARDLYRKALAHDPTLIDAETNLGVLEARSGQPKEAVSLWQDAFRRAPGRSEIGINLARAFCSTRQFNDARNYTMRVLQFNPDLGQAKTMLKQLNADPPTCGK
jgi:Flp pilus assembly protein TadD